MGNFKSEIALDPTDWHHWVSKATRDTLNNLLPSWRQQRQVCTLLLDQPGDYSFCKEADQLQHFWKVKELPRDAIMASRGNPCAAHADCGKIAALWLAITTQRRGDANLDCHYFTNDLFVYNVLLTSDYLPNDCCTPIISWKLIEKEGLHLK